MQFKPTLLAVALAAASFGAQAGSMTVAGGTFTMTNNGVFVGSANYTVDPAFSNFNLTSGYAGNGTGPTGTQTPNSIVDMSFFGAPVYTYTAASNLGSPNAAAGTIPGGPVPTYTISGNNITADLSSWFANYNGTDFNQGSSTASGTCTMSGGMCDYSISWSAIIHGGSFNGYQGSWTMTGVAAPVPEASTYGMMVVGLGLVGAAVMRRRKA